MDKSKEIADRLGIILQDGEELSEEMLDELSDGKGEDDVE